MARRCRIWSLLLAAFIILSVCGRGKTAATADDMETAQKGVEKMEEFYRQIDMPVSIRDMGIELTEEQMRELAEKCSHFGKRTIGCVKKLDKEDMYQIYRKAR